MELYKQPQHPAVHRPRLLLKNDAPCNENPTKELINDISILKPKKVFIFLDTCYSGLSRTEETLISARPVVLKATDEYLPKNFTLFSV